MNPSAKGWLYKYFKLVEIEKFQSISLADLQNNLREDGFLYGFHFKIPIEGLSNQKYSADEIAKLQLVDGLLTVFLKYNPDLEFNQFIYTIRLFYTKLGLYVESGNSVLQDDGKAALLIEKIIDQRIDINTNFLSKPFQKNVANALLYLDILAFRRFMKHQPTIEKFLFEFESNIFRITLEVAEVSEKEGNLISSEKYKSIFKDSFRFANNHGLTTTEDFRLNMRDNLFGIEKRYLIDLCCFICYSDLYYSKSDIVFIKTLAEDIGVRRKYLKASIKAVKDFFNNNKKASKKLEKSTYLNNFYNHSTIFVAKLIERNKKRLSKEVNKSRELMHLVLESQSRSLNLEEQKRVQFLLKDIIKTIPSLAILILPGGMVLLPIFAKLLPDLMPTSFDDNRT